MKRPVLALLVALILSLPIMFMGAFIALAGEEVAPSDKALQEIPADLLPIYESAARTCEGLNWTVLAAIHKVETGFGTGRATSSAGAQGPMQFMPATFAAYGVDGDGDGRAEINNVVDAIYSAANLLCANGAGDPSRLASAIWNYNHSDEYTAQVLSLAASYGVLSAPGVAYAATSDLLRNPHVALTPQARADLEAGVVDQRLVSLLSWIAQRHSIGISVFKTGHSKYTRSGNVSLHYGGSAADIFFVNGGPVSSFNTGARRLVLEMAGLTGELRPDEVGHPFGGIVFPGGFTDADHQDHIHVGFT